MLVGIHRERYGRFGPFLRKYEVILEHNGIPCRRLDASQPGFWEEVASLDLFIFRWGHYDDDRQLALTILPVVEQHMKIRCFPDNPTYWHYDDKIRQYYLLRQHGFPVVQSWVFWEKEPAVHWSKSAQYPVMFKLKAGAGSQNVVLVRNSLEARLLIRTMFGPGISGDGIPLPDATRHVDFSAYPFLRHQAGRVVRRLAGKDPSPFWQKHKNYVLFQEFLPNNDYDTRVTVLGDRAFAFRRHVRPGDYRASGSGLIDYDPAGVDLRCVRIGLEISQRLGFSSMAYDFLFDRAGEPHCCEISYTFVDTAVHDCPGYWDESLRFHEGHFWPQYCHLVDALKMPRLVQPEGDLCR
jgi:glutathione synthase/RimK-type ligase-like ATP-grasp enzyme